MKQTGTIEIPVSILDENQMVGLHREMGCEEFEFGKVRFLQSLGGTCFWMCVNGRTYQISTEHLMNAMLNHVADQQTADKSPDNPNLPVG